MHGKRSPLNKLLAWSRENILPPNFFRVLLEDEALLEEVDGRLGTEKKAMGKKVMISLQEFSTIQHGAILKDFKSYTKI